MVATQLSDFLVRQIDKAADERPDAPVEFWTRIPEVRSCCSDPRTFDKPFAVHAYAYVHLLERYRRTWAALKYLLKVSVLPLGAQGVRTLDVGTGPAPSLYAIDDFYRILIEYANIANLPELQLPEPTLDCIERSENMISFFLNFAESSQRTGPRAAFMDFSGLDLRRTRAWHQRQKEVVNGYWDSETMEYEKIYDPVTASEYSNRLFRYRLVVFSNFLTLDSHVESFRLELRALFKDLRPGSVVMILGGTGDNYQVIYDRVAALARRQGLREGSWQTNTLGRMDAGDESARIIKESQYRVYLHLEGLVGEQALCKAKDWPDYWNPTPSSRARPRFDLRIFRRGPGQSVRVQNSAHDG